MAPQDKRTGTVKRIFPTFQPPVCMSTQVATSCLLPENYRPTNWDIMCMAGRESNDHVGNKRFRFTIANNLDSYDKAKTKHQRSAVVTVIVDSVRDAAETTSGTGFIRKDDGGKRWLAVDDKTAREKVGHAIRDAIKIRKKRQSRVDEIDKVCRFGKRKRAKLPRTSAEMDKPRQPPSRPTISAKNTSQQQEAFEEEDIFDEQIKSALAPLEETLANSLATPANRPVARPGVRPENRPNATISFLQARVEEFLSSVNANVASGGPQKSVEAPLQPGFGDSTIASLEQSFMAFQSSDRCTIKSSDGYSEHKLRLPKGGAVLGTIGKVSPSLDGPEDLTRPIADNPDVFC